MRHAFARASDGRLADDNMGGRRETGEMLILTDINYGPRLLYMSI